jgi:hypothetical protein
VAVPPPPPTPPADDLPDPLTPADLDAWAARRHMQPYLAAKLDRLAAFVPVGAARTELQARHWLDGRTALLPAPHERFAPPDDARGALRRALAGIAGQIDTAVAEEEAARPRSPPDDPRLADLWRHWLTLRAALRTGAHPVRRAVRDAYVASVVSDPPLLRVDAPASVACRAAPALRFELRLLPEGDAGFPCSCPGAPSSCPARLAVLDRALDELARPDGAITQAILRELAIPPWSRALARLDAAVEAGEAAGALGWRVVDEGHLSLEPVTFRPAKAGSGFVLTKASRATADELAGEADARALDQLRAPGAVTWEQKHGATNRALRALVGHPHVFLDKAPLAVVEERWELVVSGEADGAHVLVRHGGRTSSPRAFLAGVVRQLAGGLGVVLDADQGVLRVVPMHPAGTRALSAIVELPEPVPPAGVERLLQSLERWRGLVAVSLGGTLRGDVITPRDRVEVRLGTTGPGVLRVAFRVRPLPGGVAWPPGAGPAEPYLVIDGRRVVAARDLDAERRRLAHTWQGLPGIPVADVDVTEPEVALAWLDRLRTLPDVDVTWDGSHRWRVGPVAASNVTLTAREGRSWFAVDGVVEIDHQAVPLSALLSAIRERRTYVPLGQDRWARLTDTLRGQLQALTRGQEQAEDGVDVGVAQLPLVEALVRDGASVGGSTALLDLLTRLREADLADVAPPAGLRATLRPYQAEGHRFLARLARWAPGAFLADDMGLGKTLQALALLLDRAAHGPALVVAPTSVGFNWVREAERFAPGLRVEAWRGGDRRARLGTLDAGDVLVTSYDLVQRDAEVLAEVPFATVVLDEAQAVKNASTRRWKAVAGLQRGFTVALTGTPVENRLDELWALAALVVPGLLGDATTFRATWAAPIERGLDDEVRHALSRRLRPFLLRRTKATVAPDLPERTVVDVHVPLSAEEHALYDDVRRGAIVELEGLDAEPAAQTRIRVLAALTALRRVACHPRLHDPAWIGPTSKLDRVRELVAELRAEGHKALLFSQFVGHLQLVRQALEEDGVVVRYLDGSTPEATRRAEVDAFQRGEGDVFLISLKAGGTGLNLTAASYVLHLDPWWNPAVEDQATDRAHRIGQQRPVTVYRVVAGGTVEERILELHEDKRSLVAGVLEGTDVGARLEVDDLVALLKGEEPSRPA